MAERHHGGIGPLVELWHLELAKARSGGEAIFVCFVSVFSSSSSSLRSAPQTCCPSPKVKCQTRSGLRPSLTSTPPVAGAGMEAEEAARQCTAPAMILKSRAHTAACKLRRRGCCGSASSAALHGAHIIVPILTTTQSSHSWRSGPFGEISPWLAMLTGCPD